MIRTAGGGELAVHPAADLFPLLGEESLRELAADIDANGLVEPVWLCEGELLDGRNRVRACELVGVEVKTRTYTGTEPTAFVISQNLKRRHLTTGQKADVSRRALPLLEAEAAKRKAQAPGEPRGQKQSSLGADRPQETKRAPRARDKAAKLTGTSGRAVARSKRIAEAAPDLSEKVRDGSMSLDRAERIIRDREAEQRRIEEARQEAAAQPEPTTVDIRHGDFRDVLADLHDVDAIITDPPYPREFLPLLGDLAIWADKILAPDGVLAVLIGQSYLPDVYRLLDGYRAYRWTACYLTTGPAYVAHQRHVQSQWKPLLVYGGGPRFSDVVKSTGVDADAKHNHKWGQDYNAFHTIVERLTKHGETVVDPFAGSGTTLLAAHALGRNAIGCDIDAEAVRTAQERFK